MYNSFLIDNYYVKLEPTEIYSNKINIVIQSLFKKNQN